MVTFLWPWVFLAIPIPFIYRWLRKPAKITIKALRAPFLLAAVNDQPAVSRVSLWNKRLVLCLLALCWVFMLVALARPVFIGEPVALPTAGRDILIAVDISGSMEREDMVVRGRAVNRLVAVKAVVGDFVIERSGDRLGLVLFGEKAYLQTPLTFDRETMQTLLLEAQIGFAGNGTAIGDAIGLSVKRLQERPKDHRVLILMTDGSNNTGVLKPLEAAEIAKRAGVKIYTIGIGAETQAQRGLFGSTMINPSADLDESTLIKIAEATDGQYFRARDPQELSTIYAKLNQLEPIDQDAETIRPVMTLYHWPMALSFVLSFLIFILRGNRARLFS